MVRWIDIYTVLRIAIRLIIWLAGHSTFFVWLPAFKTANIYRQSPVKSPDIKTL